MDFKDYYQILGVAKGATPDEIKKAYRALARKHHPDVNTSEKGEARFKEIGEAYAVLNDPEKRAKYDQYGAAWKAAEQGGNGFGGQGFDFGDVDSAFQGGQFGSFYDILEHVFGGQASPGPGGFGRGSQGSGSFGGFRVNVGGNFDPRFRPRGPHASRGGDREATLRLSLEEGAGGGRRSVKLADPVTGKSKTYNVNLPKGVQPGQKIRLAGQGEVGGGGTEPGDLYLSVELIPHPVFRLVGRDLFTTVEIAPWEAALGATVNMRTLGGAVRTKVPPGVRPEQEIRLRGKGYPGSQGTGDLYVKLRIYVPEKLPGESRRLYEELAQTYEGLDAGRKQSAG